MNELNTSPVSTEVTNVETQSAPVAPESQAMPTAEVSEANAQAPMVDGHGEPQETTQATVDSQPQVGLLNSEPEVDEPATSEAEDGAQQAKALGAPESYVFKNADGSEVKHDASPIVSAFSDVAKELDLSQESASKIYEKLAPVISQQPYEAVAFLRKSGAEQCSKDPEIGGVNFKDNLKVCNRAFNDQRFVSPELRTLLNQTGLDSHPEVLRLFYRVGKLTGEGEFIRSETQAPRGPDYRSRYPNSNLK